MNVTNPCPPLVQTRGVGAYIRAGDESKPFPTQRDGGGEEKGRKMLRGRGLGWNRQEEGDIHFATLGMLGLT